MRVSLNWLKDYVDIQMDVEELAHKLTMLGIEIEAIERPGAEITNVFIGKILSIDPHPDADKLVVCKTDIGQDTPLTIVCGAKNMKPGDIVPTAIIGATLPGGFQIGRRKMRGIESEGMMCSARELGISDEHAGLLIMDPDLPVGADALPYLGLDDVIFEIEVTPNRGDWACMIGVAREIAALLGTTMRLPQIEIAESAPEAAALSSVTIENPDLCPRYAGRILTDVKIGPSPEWLCKRLIAAGQRPINNIVDITNYVMLETGQPLHAFDYDLLKENRIVVRTPKAGETITTLDGQKRELAPDMLIIADAEVPVAVAGVMGGGDSEVGEMTTRIFLESAFFKPSSVRKTSRALALTTEASQRFQRGADPEMAVFAINRAAMLMQQVAGARVANGILDEYPNPLPEKTITLRYSGSDLLLGTAVKPEAQRTFIESLGFTIIKSDAASFTVRVPSWRHDATQEADLIEEVARLHGYDNIQTALPTVHPGERVFAPREAAVRRLRESLVGFGLTEFCNWTFSCPEDVNRCRLEPQYQNMVTLQNPLSENQATMRSSLIPGLMANVSRNVRHGSTDIAAFEIGPIYVPVEGRDLPNEPLHVAVVLSGNDSGKHWSRPQQAFDLYDIKGYCEAIADLFGTTPIFEAAECPTFQFGQCATVAINGAVIGRFGEVRKDILKDYDVDQSVYMLELELAPLFDVQAPRPQHRTVPMFPPSRRDMAVLVDSAVAAGDISKAAAEIGGKILKSVDIFDIYTGKQVPAGKKSVALSLMFQSEERTLTDKDTQKTWDRILKKLEADFKAELR